MEANAVQRERWDFLYELVLTHSMSWFIGIWVFFFGTCLGSFLNVVAYRIPNGMTILGSSRCPWCLVTIESKYNFPILGWLMLRGRCAACRLPISARYVIVEIIAGLILVWLFLFELVSNGENLPRDRDYQIGILFKLLAAGNVKDLWNQDWSLVRIFVLHCFVAYTLLTASLMRLDRLKIPGLWKWLHYLFVVIAIAVWPSDMSFAQADFQLEAGQDAWYERLRFQLTGCCLGAVLGFQYQQIVGDRDSGLLFGMALVGMACGWIAALSIGTLFLLLLGISSLANRSGFLANQPMFLLLAALLLQIAAWKFLDGMFYWPNNSASSLVVIAYLVPGTLAVVLINSRRVKRLQLANQIELEVEEKGGATGEADSSSTQ